MNEVLIIGGGWAGISAAVTLTNKGVPVRLIEASPALGGRARSVPFDNTLVDNGQHLLIGGYKEYRALLATLQCDEKSLFDIYPFIWQMQGSQNIEFPLPKLPKPFNQIFGLITAKGLSWRDKIQAARLMSKLDKIIHNQDQSVELTLKQYNQSTTLIEGLWDPMCLAALSTPIRKASSRVFARVLKDALTQDNHFSSLWFAKKDISKILPKPAQDYINQHHGHVHVHTRATELIIQDNEVIGVKTSKGAFYGPVIMATPYWVTQKLLPPQSCQKLIEQMTRLQSESISTIYIQYHESVSLPSPMIGLSGTLSQWVFDRKFAGQKGLIAVVISASGSHLSMEKTTLFEKIASELKAYWPQCDNPKSWKIIHEKRGAFSCEVDVEIFRPTQVTPINHLYLAGDYTLTPYPSTIEGAVISGQIAASEVLKRYKHHEQDTPPLSLSA